MLKILAVAMICALIILYLKNINSDLYLLACVVSGLILLGFTIDYLRESFAFVGKLIEISGVDNEFYKIIFKTVTIGYLFEFSAQTIRDAGLNGVADKLIFTGKIIIFCLSTPIFYSVLSLLTGIIK